MRFSATTRRMALGLAAVVFLGGCENSEVGTVGPQRQAEQGGDDANANADANAKPRRSSRAGAVVPRDVRK